MHISRERLGLSILILSQDAIHTGLFITSKCTVGKTQSNIFPLRFLVDGSWKVKEGEGEEVEEDEKGEKANVLIVEEEEEEEQVEQGAEKKEIIEEAAKEEVATIQDVLDTLTLENKQEIIDIKPEETKSSEILKEELSKEEKVEEKIENKVEEEVEKEIVKKVEPKVEIKETRSRKGKVTDKENTPKIQKESALAKEGTPKNGTPVIKASKLGTPMLGTPKVSCSHLFVFSSPNHV